VDVFSSNSSSANCGVVSGEVVKEGFGGGGHTSGAWLQRPWRAIRVWVCGAVGRMMWGGRKAEGAMAERLQVKRARYANRLV